eukprot:m.276718 g.276718  ORF g.276718 m.276718 type:complete len:51 (-) comp125786_c0_seq1:194-346(-)
MQLACWWPEEIKENLWEGSRGEEEMSAEHGRCNISMANSEGGRTTQPSQN